MYFIWQWKSGFWQPTGWWTRSGACTALLPRALADWFFIYDDKIQIFGTGVMTGMQATVQLCPFI
jgi:uncharacterized membrane protein